MIKEVKMYTVGDKRVVFRFALFPMKVDGVWIMWKWYWARQIYKEIDIPGERGPFGHPEYQETLWSTYDTELNKNGINY